MSTMSRDKEKIISAFQEIVNVPVKLGLNDEEIVILYGMVVGAMSQVCAKSQPNVVLGYLQNAIESNGLSGTGTVLS